MLFALDYGVKWKKRRNVKQSWIHQWMELIVTLESGVKLENVPVKCLSLDIWKGNGVRGVLVAELATLESAVDSVDALEKPCALFCSPNGKDQRILVTEKVMDGTSCGPQNLDICANGRCQKFGCDGILGSLAWEDHCGVCNGDGKSCRVIKGDFNHTRGTGYVEALVIPAGARRIKVVEEKPAHSYLDHMWQKSKNDSAKKEAAMFVNLIQWSLPGVLLFQDHHYGLHYEYTISLDLLPENQSSKVSEPLFMWTHSGWEDCGAICGGGERKTTVSCTKIMNKNISFVDNKKCKYLTKPEPQIRKCNEQPCQTR
uniref:A disintegrin and metalloproteinase with thrombospondin motifs 19 n=1 Tax=Sphaerodactylus townsendi TaxID=933632 RepID=A0ACB8ERX5_9SAUR